MSGGRHAQGRQAAYTQVIAVLLSVAGALAATLSYFTGTLHDRMEYATVADLSKTEEMQVASLKADLATINAKLAAVSQSLKDNPANSKILEGSALPKQI